MIGIVFSYINDVVEVRIDGDNCLFRTGQYGGAFVPIEGLKLDKNGVLKEHPDLKDNNDWNKIAIERFKEYMKQIKTEDEKADYIINELKKVGYKPMAKQKNGFRIQKIK